MTAFRLFVFGLWATIAAYTAYVTLAFGLNILPIFVGDITSLTWRGQFNLDFLTYLWLSGLWIAWRQGFSAGGIALGIAASILGMVVFAVYLLVQSVRTKGDMRRLLLGVHAD